MARWREGRRAEARALVGAEVIRDTCVVGPARSVPEQLERFAAVGIDVPVLRLADPFGLERQAAMLREIASALGPT